MNDVDVFGAKLSPTLVAILALLVALTLLVLCATAPPLRAIIRGQDNRTSTSKTTALVWTLFVFGVFATLITLAIVSSPAALMTAAGQLAQAPSDDYLLLLGGPFAALVGAKGIVSTRVANGSLEKTTAPVMTPGDLVKDDNGNTDLVDAQFLLFNFLALAWAINAFLHNPTNGLPEIPGGLTALTSVSALAYLGNKAVERATPRITSLTPRPVKVGAELTIDGENLQSPARGVGGLSVTVGGLLTEIKSSTGKRIVVIVPDDAPVSDNVAVTVVLASGTPGAGGSTSTPIQVVSAV